jgi:heme O synthase-like polyprenyltransferase
MKMDLLLGFLSPLFAALLCYSIIRNCNFKKLIFFLFFVIVTFYFSITTLGPEGPFYRIYVCIITIILLLMEVIALNSDKGKIKMKLLYFISLLCIIILLFFSEGFYSF